jgi:PBSX family phage terminase large subunit
VILTPAQNQIASHTHRFRVLNCGRRFGKTSLAIEEIKGKALGTPSHVLYIAPTIQQARDIAWEQIKRELRPIEISKKEAPSLEIRVRTVQGGESVIKLRGWEAVETLRGQSFDFLVIDEVASMRNFWVGWNEVLSPTLTDRKGEALFISTPKGFNHFYDLYNLRERDQDYASFHYTTYDNPHIPVEEIEREKRSKPENAFAQEYLADFRKAEGLVYKEFDRAKHVYTEIAEGTGFIETVAGVDFGFIHPAAVEVAKIDRAGGLWITDELYQSHLTDIEIAEYVAALPGVARVFPDPESPSAIEELKRHSVNVRPVVKGKDSEKHGIDKVRELLKANKLHVHRDCKGLITEFETHAYKEAKDEPEETGEDALDALRYMVMMIQPEAANDNEAVDDVDEPIYGQIGV